VTVTTKTIRQADGTAHTETESAARTMPSSTAHDAHSQFCRTRFEHAPFTIYRDRAPRM
jgi:hypothetical protein